MMPRNENESLMAQEEDGGEVCIYPGRVYTSKKSHSVLYYSSILSLGCTLAGAIVIVAMQRLDPVPLVPVGIGIVCGIVAGVTFFCGTKKAYDVENPTPTNKLSFSH